MRIEARRRLRIAILLVGLALLTDVSIGSAQTLMPLSVDDALDRAFVTRDIALSPDGRFVAYTVCRRPDGGLTKQSDWTPTGLFFYLRGCSVAVTSLKTGETFKPVAKPSAISVAQVWSPDSQSLAFISDEDNAARVWVLDVASRKVRPLSKAPVRALQFRREGTLAWSSDGRYIVTKLPPDSDKAEPIIGDQSERIEQPAPNIRVLRWPQPATTAKEDAGFTEVLYQKELRGDLGAIDVKTGALRRLSRDATAMWVRLSPDGTAAIYQNRRAVRGLDYQYEATIVSLADGHVIQQVTHVSRDTYPGPPTSWSPSGRLVTFADCRFLSHDHQEIDLRNTLPIKSCGQTWAESSDELLVVQQRPSEDQADIWRIDPTMRTAVRVAQVPGIRVQLIMRRDLNRAVTGGSPGDLFVVAIDPKSRDAVISQVRRDGQVKETARMAKALGAVPDYYGRDVSADGRLLAFVSEDAQHAPDIWSLTLGAAEPRQISHANPQLERYQFGPSQLIHWRGGLDGREMAGALFLPAGYEPGRRYPLLTVVYGVSKLSESIHEFTPESAATNIQLFTTRGYAVLCPDSYADPTRPTASIVASIMPGVDAVVAMGVADPRRLAVLGHSYGAYTALSLLVNTNRFRAAMVVAGVYDLWRAYGDLDAAGNASMVDMLEHTEGFLGASPWEARDRYIENSPMFALDHVQTPLLIFHGGKDLLSDSQADALFVGLRRLNKEVEYVRYATGVHSFTRTEYEPDFLQRTVDWFDRHLGKSDETTASRDQ